MAQLHRPSLRTREKQAAQSALAAARRVTKLSRTEIAQLFAGGNVESTTAAEELEEPTDGATVATIFTYAALLKLCTLWTSSRSKAERRRAFFEYLKFLANDREMLPIYTVQLAANLWLHDERANAQAARLLKFSQVTDADALRAIWGAAWDVNLLSLQGMLDEMFRDEQALDMVIVTADRALVELRQFAPKIGTGVFSEGDGEVRSALVSLNIPENMIREVQPMLDQLQEERIGRAKCREYYSQCLGVVLALVDRLEAELLLRARSAV